MDAGGAVAPRRESDRLVGQLYLGQEGIFGLPLGVAATFVFMFVLFGAFLEKTGAGKFFIDLAFAATGRKPGGPAKAAVIASAGMGSISGSAIANVVTTGAFTIPLMKKAGLQAQTGRRDRGRGLDRRADHAAADGGGGVPDLGIYQRALYRDRHGLDLSGDPVSGHGLSVRAYRGDEAGHEGHVAAELPLVRQVLAAGWQFIVPLVLLVWLLVNNISPMRVGFWAIISVIAVAGCAAHGCFMPMGR
jgi:TRAP-type uncharacterized transport system fused permease subunit